MRFRSVGVAALTAISVLAGAVAALSQTAPKPLDFDREIRPIFSDNCFKCHGPDEKQRMANLRLDETEGLFRDRGGYSIIVPGNTAASRLYQRVSAADPVKRMPPPYSDRSLTPAQVELIKTWIEQGAKWEKHWAWLAPVRPAVPQVALKSWPRNPIDNFVLARLEREGLKPSPEADRATLLRRVSFELTGLPPTPAEVDAFVKDPAPDAYEKRVDALLASPHYGERMASPWLDLARYSDTHGYHIDSLRNMWTWRDWVIKAFNTNMPYDRFTVEQLAGDLLPNATLDQKIASGFNRNHMINFEGGAIPAEYHVEYVVDRVSTTATTFLGLTMGCARCHDHKYDPIKQKDFYKFFAFFNTVPERGLDGTTGNADPVLEMPSPEQEQQRADLKSRIGATLTALPEARMVDLENQWRQNRLASIPDASADGLTAWYEFEDGLKDSSGHGQDARAARGDVGYNDGVVRKAVEFSGETQVDFGKAGDFDRDRPFSLALWMNPEGLKSFEILQKHEPGPNWRGYDISVADPVFVGTFERHSRIVLKIAHHWPDDAIEVETKDRVLGSAAFESLRLTSFRHLVVDYDGSGKASGIKMFLNGSPVELVAKTDHLTGSFSTPEPLSAGNKNLGTPLKGQLDDFRIYNRTITSEEAHNLAVNQPVRALLGELDGKAVKEIGALKPESAPAEPEIGELSKAEKPEDQTADQLKDHQRRLSEYFLTAAAPESDRALYKQLKDLRASLEKVQKAIPTTMVMTEMKTPRDTFILGRGQYDNPGEKVGPGVPSFLPPLPTNAPLNRLTLAKWIVDPANPLTARVAVNHFWQEAFGIGLVKTSEDFGSQGEPPSHPELLDWLATQFVQSGWDVKAMERLIVTSAAYRQSSRTTRDLVDRDPENRLIAHGPRFRLPAEAIRDNALAVSGLLSPRIGGPSAYPYQPKGIWEELAFGQGFSGQTYVEDTGEGLYRRSLYTVRKRTAPPPALITFDAPDREKCTARRLVTNTPLQALELENDPTYVEASRFLAQHAIREAGSDPSRRVDWMFRVATARTPKASERAVLLDLAQAEIAEYRSDRAAAAKLLTVGTSRPDPKIDPSELAAWTTVASTILNLDETITSQ